jgi:pimeloyl-ACP methyl ester carboxylesterase
LLTGTVCITEAARPVRTTVGHTAAAAGRGAWLRTDTYHVTLDQGALPLTRWRAVRFAGGQGAGGMGLQQESTRVPAGATVPTRAAVLLVPGFAQGAAAYDVPGRSLAAFLAEAGYDVWAVDLRGTRGGRALGAPLAVGVHEVRA